jgi:hypothetical protein
MTEDLDPKALHAACRHFDVEFWDEGFRTEIYPESYTEFEKAHLDKAMAGAIRAYLAALKTARDEEDRHD